MIISALRVLDHVTAESVLKVVDMEGNDAFPAGFDRIVELATAGQICGRMKSHKLRYLELIVPLSETVAAFRAVEHSGSINAQTNLGAYRQKLETHTCWALCLSRGFDGALA